MYVVCTRREERGGGAESERERKREWKECVQLYTAHVQVHVYMLTVHCVVQLHVHIKCMFVPYIVCVCTRYHNYIRVY